MRLYLYKPINPWSDTMSIRLISFLLSALLAGCASTLEKAQCQLEECRIVQDPNVETLCLRYEGRIPMLHPNIYLWADGVTRLLFVDPKSGEVHFMNSPDTRVAAQYFTEGKAYTFLKARGVMILPPKFALNNKGEYFVQSQIVKTCGA